MARLLLLGLGHLAVSFNVMLWAADETPTRSAVLEWEGKVEVARRGSLVWDPAYTNQVLFPGDQVRTGERSRALIRVSELTTLRLGEVSRLQVPEGPGKRSRLLQGLFYFFHRDKPGEIPLETPSAYAVIIGTEFHVAVTESETTTLQVLEGIVEMTNAAGHLRLVSGEAGSAAPGMAPQPTARLDAVNLVQWCLYYPGVLDLGDLRLAPAEQQKLNESLNAYRAGDLLAALQRYPAGAGGASDQEQIYYAVLLLAVGQVENAQARLRPLAGDGAKPGPVSALALALQRLIAAVKGQSDRAVPDPASATEWMAESYVRQARRDLAGALAAARQAVARAPQFGFGWTRVAELEFGYGHIDEAMAALEQALRLAPRHAQALSLKGYLLSAQNRVREAMHWFNQAIALDGALGQAWLGRGLCRIRLGDEAGGREDLQVAVTLEPQRALYRSYLGKAFSRVNDPERAERELRLAQDLDPRDPTAWLYAALVKQQRNRINEAVRDLERAQKENDQRAVYRSRLLLDQDRAVGGVNLASVYQDAGLQEVSAREATRAVETDYANYSAHLFLGNSYQALRDPSLVNQRFETPAVSEYLLANLLAPVGAGTLAQSVSLSEYSKLFESDGLGLNSLTEYSSNGDWLQSAVQHGTFGNWSYALSGFYRSLNGWRANQELEQTEISLQMKYQVSPHGSLYVRAIGSDLETGDLLQRYDPAQANRTLHVEERPAPLLLAGYHHEWTPEFHTLLLGGWLMDRQEVSNGQQESQVFVRNNAGDITQVVPIALQQRYVDEVGFGTIELQQFWQRPDQGWILGGRYQAGEFRVHNGYGNALVPLPFPSDLLIHDAIGTNQQHVSPELERASVYGYYHWRPFEPLLLTAGLSYDHLNAPENFRYGPVSEGQQTHSRWSPKGGAIWSPAAHTTVRAGYAQSLGGAGFEQSFAIEPTQVAGLNQSFRSIIPESVAGANTGAKFESWGALLEQGLGPNTYLGLGGEWLRSEVEREVGVYDFVPLTFTASPGQTRENLDYLEQTLRVTLHRLIDRDWSLGVRYQLSQAILEDRFVDIPATATPGAGFRPHSRLDSVLHQLVCSANFNHPSGIFARGEVIWSRQSNEGYSPNQPGDDFWQWNLYAGYRVWQRRLEFRVGLLNITGQDYRIAPLNLTPELPRERTLVMGLKMVF
ncbi:MAG TPA: TonB-dependent receptor [Verrucomicrobiae bacterium]|nr:TonB-dependent receptor [Verrucomicrobiae bacterium]